MGNQKSQAYQLLLELSTAAQSLNHGAAKQRLNEGCRLARACLAGEATQEQLSKLSEKLRNMRRRLDLYFENIRDAKGKNAEARSFDDRMMQQLATNFLRDMKLL